MTKENVVVKNNTPSPRCLRTHPLPQGARKTARGFTLIELLVVVLIIGILAAVAVPQYQKAVYKSKYAKLKNLTKSIVMAQEVYYLANGSYAEKFDELDIDMPSGKLDNSTNDIYYYDWGTCYFQTQGALQASCQDSAISMAYQHRFSHSPEYPNARTCVAYATDIKDIRSQICQAETGRTENTGGGDSKGYLTWRY